MLTENRGESMADTKFYEHLRKRAESYYSNAAAGYRSTDEAAKDDVSHAGKCKIIHDLTGRFGKPIRMLDLGCGTGRYFHCVKNVEWIVGVDPSHQMLEHARNPVDGKHSKVTLVRSTLHEVAFAPASFDLVICVGVLTYWCPVDEFVMRRVSAMLRDGGGFFFTVREPRRDPATLKQRAATLLRPVLFGAPRRYVESRVTDFGVTEEQVRSLAEPFFRSIEIDRWLSTTGRMDLHCVASGAR